MRSVFMFLGMLFFVTSTAGALEMPPEIKGVTVGMSKDALLKARPVIKRIGAMGTPIDLSLSKLALMEDVPSGSGPFTSITFVIEDNKVVAVALTGYPARGQERTVRKKLLQECRQRWGKPKRHVVANDPIRKGRGIASLTWESEGAEIVLMLPVDREGKDTKVTPASLQIRATRATNKALKEMTISAKEKQVILKQNDIEDAETP